MEDWQATLAVVGNLIAFIVLTIVVVHDRSSNKNGQVSNRRRNTARVSGRGATGYGHQGRGPGSGAKATASRRRSKPGQVLLPDHLQKLAEDQQQGRKDARTISQRKQDEQRNGLKGGQKRDSELTDTQLAVIIAEATRGD